MSFVGVFQVETKKSKQREGKTMSDHAAVSAGWHHLGTILSHAARPERVEEGSFVTPPITRGSTVVFPSIESMSRQEQKRYDHATIYGAMGSPIQYELEKVVAKIEGGTDCQIVSSGLSACTMPLMAFLNAGDHCLISDNVYGPTRRFAEKVLKRFGVEISYFPPMVSAHELESFFRPHTRCIFVESPGSHTFEVQDIPMLVSVTHQHGAKLLMDNTWGFGIFSPFKHGVDVSIQALTKYPAGHSDLVLGAITVANTQDWHRLRDTALQIGQVAGPEECWLTLRGLRTMGIRLAHQSRSAFEIATWLKQQPEIAAVHHPALPDCPGHAFWKRDFKGAGCVFSVLLHDRYSVQEMKHFINALSLFSIGASWGGYESLVLPTTGEIIRDYPDQKAMKHAIFRLQIGLENIQDLKKDLRQALDRLSL